MSESLPHTALIYIDQQDRNRLINSCLHRANIGWRSLAVVSAQPKADAKFFRGMIRRKSRRDKHGLSVVDVTHLHKGKGTAKEITSVIIQKRAELGKRPLVIGDWLHQVYGQFEVGLAVEEALSEANLDNIVCCYRGEGFWSLHIKQIARVFELHSQVLFGSSVFDNEVQPDLRQS